MSLQEKLKAKLNNWLKPKQENKNFISIYNIEGNYRDLCPKDGYYISEEEKQNKVELLISASIHRHNKPIQKRQFYFDGMFVNIVPAQSEDLIDLQDCETFIKHSHYSDIVDNFINNIRLSNKFGKPLNMPYVVAID